MTWDALAAIAELLGALGVIASLVYLGIQVRSSTAQSRQAAAQSVQSKLNSLLETLAVSPPLSDAYVRGSRGLSSLTDPEAMQVSAFYLALLRAYEELLHYRESGAIDDWAWTSVHSTLRAVASAPGFAEWWRARGNWFSEDFQRHVASDVISSEHRDLAAELRSRGKE